MTTEMATNIALFCIAALMTFIVIGAIDTTKRCKNKRAYKMGYLSLLFVPFNWLMDKSSVKKQMLARVSMRDRTVSRVALIISIINMFLIIVFIILAVLDLESTCFFYTIGYFILMLPLSFFIEVEKKKN